MDFNSRKKNHKFLKIGILIGILILFFLYRYNKYNYYIKTPVNAANSENISLIVKQGETAKDVAAKLFEKDLILNEKSFIKYVKKNDIDKNIVAGRFLLNQGMTTLEIAEKITNINQGEVVLTIPEGYTVTQIDQKLADLSLIENGDFTKAVKDFSAYSKYDFLNEENQKKLAHPLEGFLFPDTYFLNPNNFVSEDLIGLMLRNFGNKFEAAQERTIFETIIMASIIEKEVKTNEDRAIVSGILWKRLDEGWQLGADATLLYLKSDREIDYEDLKEESKYNTRKFTGLPPGPISNPGLKSIQAAINPEPSNYYYYLTKPGSGEVVYARTNEEHNENRAKYLN